MALLNLSITPQSKDQPSAAAFGGHTHVCSPANDIGGFQSILSAVIGTVGSQSSDTGETTQVSVLSTGLPADPQSAQTYLPDNGGPRPSAGAVVSGGRHEIACGSGTGSDQVLMMGSGGTQAGVSMAHGAWKSGAAPGGGEGEAGAFSVYCATSDSAGGVSSGEPVRVGSGTMLPEFFVDGQEVVLQAATTPTLGTTAGMDVKTGHGGERTGIFPAFAQGMGAAWPDKAVNGTDPVILQEPAWVSGNGQGIEIQGLPDQATAVRMVRYPAQGAALGYRIADSPAQNETGPVTSQGAGGHSKAVSGHEKAGLTRGHTELKGIDVSPGASAGGPAGEAHGAGSGLPGRLHEAPSQAVTAGYGGHGPKEPVNGGRPLSGIAAGVSDAGAEDHGVHRESLPPGAAPEGSGGSHPEVSAVPAERQPPCPAGSLDGTADESVRTGRGVATGGQIASIETGHVASLGPDGTLSDSRREDAQGWGVGSPIPSGQGVSVIPDSVHPTDLPDSGDRRRNVPGIHDRPARGEAQESGRVKQALSGRTLEIDTTGIDQQRMGSVSAASVDLSNSEESSPFRSGEQHVAPERLVRPEPETHDGWSTRPESLLPGGGLPVEAQSATPGESRADAANDSPLPAGATIAVSSELLLSRIVVAEELSSTAQIESDQPEAPRVALGQYYEQPQYGPDRVPGDSTGAISSVSSPLPSSGTAGATISGQVAPTRGGAAIPEHLEGNVLSERSGEGSLPVWTVADGQAADVDSPVRARGAKAGMQVGRGQAPTQALSTSAEPVSLQTGVREGISELRSLGLLPDPAGGSHRTVSSGKASPRWTLTPAVFHEGVSANGQFSGAAESTRGSVKRLGLQSLAAGDYTLPEAIAEDSPGNPPGPALAASITGSAAARVDQSPDQGGQGNASVVSAVPGSDEPAAAVGGLVGTFASVDQGRISYSSPASPEKLVGQDKGMEGRAVESRPGAAKPRKEGDVSIVSAMPGKGEPEAVVGGLAGTFASGDRGRPSYASSVSPEKLVGQDSGMEERAIESRPGAAKQWSEGSASAVSAVPGSGEPVAVVGGLAGTSASLDQGRNSYSSPASPEKLVGQDNGMEEGTIESRPGAPPYSQASVPPGLHETANYGVSARSTQAGSILSTSARAAQSGQVVGAASTPLGESPSVRAAVGGSFVASTPTADAGVSNGRHGRFGHIDSQDSPVDVAVPGGDSGRAEGLVAGRFAITAEPGRAVEPNVLLKTVPSGGVQPAIVVVPQQKVAVAEGSRTEDATAVSGTGVGRDAWASDSGRVLVEQGSSATGALGQAGEDQGSQTANGDRAALGEYRSAGGTTVAVGRRARLGGQGFVHTATRDQTAIAGIEENSERASTGTVDSRRGSRSEVESGPASLEKQEGWKSPAAALVAEGSAERKRLFSGVADAAKPGEKHLGATQTAQTVGQSSSEQKGRPDTRAQSHTGRQAEQTSGAGSASISSDRGAAQDVAAASRPVVVDQAGGTSHSAAMLQQGARASTGDVVPSHNAPPGLARAPEFPEPEDLLPQIVRSAILSAQRGGASITLRLDPPELGALRMRLTSDAGGVSASITVERPDLKQSIESNLHQLRTTLSDHGVQVHSLIVTVGDDPRQGQSRPDYPHQPHLPTNQPHSDRNARDERQEGRRPSPGRLDRRTVDYFA